jgi:hypothetical protein
MGLTDLEQPHRANGHKKELLCHATIEMTMRYAHLSPHVRKDAVKLLEMTHDTVPTGCQQALAAGPN